MSGVSERVPTRSEGGVSFPKRLLAEAVKWGGACVFAFGYLCRLQPLKGWYLLRMRWYFSCGLLSGMLWFCRGSFGSVRLRAFHNLWL